MTTACSDFPGVLSRLDRIEWQKKQFYVEEDGCGSIETIRAFADQTTRLVDWYKVDEVQAAYANKPAEFPNLTTENIRRAFWIWD